MLLTGETGVGKEVCAAAIHRATGRAGDFVAVNCAALPRDLVETELFGYARGGHSQAATAKPGIIERAAGGTLFLDEVGDMAPELQTKLLRFTQDRVLRPIGGSIRAADRYLHYRRHKPGDSISRSPTRPDCAQIWQRDSVRNRFGFRHCASGSRTWAHSRRTCQPGRVKAYDLPAFQALCLYHWPGNVRELSKVVAAAGASLNRPERIGLMHIPQTIAAPSICDRRRDGERRVRHRSPWNSKY